MKRWVALPAGAWRAVKRQPAVALLNLAIPPGIGIAMWGWLYLPDSNVALVGLSALLALAMACGVLTLLQYTFLSYYRDHYPMPVVASVNIHPREKALWRRAAGGLPLLALWLLLFGTLCGGLSYVQRQTLEWAKPVASWMTMFTQRPVSFYDVNAWMSGVIDFLQWVALPMLFLAAFAGMAGAAAWGAGRGGWIRHALQLLRMAPYWALWLLFLTVSLWLPGQLVGWTPSLEGIPAATASLVLRFGIAYLLLLGGWLLFLSALAKLLKFPKQSVILVRRSMADPV